MFGRWQVFPCGQDIRRSNGIGRFLRSRIKLAHGFNRIAQAFDPAGSRLARRKNINNPASHAEFPWNIHHRHASVAGTQQLVDQRFPVHLAFRVQADARPGERGLWNQALEGGGWGRNDHRGSMGTEAKERLHTLCDQVDGESTGSGGGLAAVWEARQGVCGQCEARKEERHILEQ